MNTLAPAQPCVNPPARHGTCRLTLAIDDTSYSLRPHPAPQPGARVWILRVLSGPRVGRVYSVAVGPGAARVPACTCPDASRGARCKHLGALLALGLLELPAAEQAPAGKLARARKRHRPVVAAAPAARELVPAAAGSFTEGFRQAVAKHVAGLAR